LALPHQRQPAAPPPHGELCGLQRHQRPYRHPLPHRG